MWSVYHRSEGAAGLCGVSGTVAETDRVEDGWRAERPQRTMDNLIESCHAADFHGQEAI